MAEYLAGMAGVYAVATIQRRLASISKAHRALGVDDPGKSELVKSTMRGILRTYGLAQRQATALLRDDLFAMLDKLGSRPKDIRDRALLLLGFATAMRRSELAALDVGDLEFVTKGMLVTRLRSKTDQEAQGRKIAVPFGRSPPSAAQAGASTYKIRQTTGHRSEASLSRYVRDSDLFTDAAIARVL